jgi:hypothetical protein
MQGKITRALGKVLGVQLAGAGRTAALVLGQEGQGVALGVPDPSALMLIQDVKTLLKGMETANRTLAGALQVALRNGIRADGSARTCEKGGKDTLPEDAYDTVLSRLHNLSQLGGVIHQGGGEPLTKEVRVTRCPPPSPGPTFEVASRAKVQKLLEADATIAILPTDYIFVPVARKKQRPAGAQTKRTAPGGPRGTENPAAQAVGAQSQSQEQRRRVAPPQELVPAVERLGVTNEAPPASKPAAAATPVSTDEEAKEWVQRAADNKARALAIQEKRRAEKDAQQALVRAEQSDNDDEDDVGGGVAEDQGEEQGEAAAREGSGAGGAEEGADEKGAAAETTGDEKETSTAKAAKAAKGVTGVERRRAEGKKGRRGAAYYFDDHEQREHKDPEPKIPEGFEGSVDVFAAIGMALEQKEAMDILIVDTTKLPEHTRLLPLYTEEGRRKGGIEEDSAFDYRCAMRASVLVVPNAGDSPLTTLVKTWQQREAAAQRADTKEEGEERKQTRRTPIIDTTTIESAIVGRVEHTAIDWRHKPPKITGVTTEPKGEKEDPPMLANPVRENLGWDSFEAIAEIISPLIQKHIDQGRPLWEGDEACAGFDVVGAGDASAVTPTDDMKPSVGAIRKHLGRTAEPEEDGTTVDLEGEWENVVKKDADALIDTLNSEKKSALIWMYYDDGVHLVTEEGQVTDKTPRWRLCRIEKTEGAKYRYAALVPGEGEANEITPEMCQHGDLASRTVQSLQTEYAAGMIVKEKEQGWFEITDRDLHVVHLWAPAEPQGGAGGEQTELREVQIPARYMDDTLWTIWSGLMAAVDVGATFEDAAMTTRTSGDHRLCRPLYTFFGLIETCDRLRGFRRLLQGHAGSMMQH